MRRISIIAAAALLAAIGGTGVAAAETAVSRSPVVNHLLTGSTLTGDWFGNRGRLANKGVTFDLSVTQVTQGVLDGGKDSSWRYGGRGNLTVKLDSQKLGLWPGGFLTVELEGNWAESVNGSTGALMPANTNQLFPVPTRDNLALPELSFAQFLSPYAGLTIGKFDTLSGDANEFAHGKGDDKFFNTAFNINPVALVVPYSPLGAGAIVLPTQDPEEAVITFLVLSASGNAATAGFDDLDSDNLLFTMEGRLRTNFFGLTGHQLVGALYSNRSYTSLDQRLEFVLENRTLARVSDTWAVFYNFDQYLYELDETQDRGVGVFGRFGASKGDPNPAQYFFSFGVGGKGVSPSRPLDRVGVGYYYIIIENPTFEGLQSKSSFLENEWGFELFYNIALTPWMMLTPDIQVIGPAQKARRTGALTAPEPVDVATVFGLRLQLIF